jgi:pimeloyl-ACP methyl ester carboxylesterase
MQKPSNQITKMEGSGSILIGSKQSSEQIQLADGRTLGFAEYGDPSGRVVFFLHGQPGNRLFHPDPEITRIAGIHLVVPDRPGYGLSTYDPQRTLLDWPQDLLQLAHHLSADPFGLIGFSGGGPYALACGTVIPEKISRLLLISSAPPVFDRSLRKKMPFLIHLNYWLLHLSPKLFNLSFKMYWKQARKNPHQFINMAKAQSSRPDRILLEKRATAQMLLACWQENLRVESIGYAKDAEILFSDWGFDLDKISTEVWLWWGEQDHNTPASVQESIASQLPNAKILRQANAGHFGFLQVWDRICMLMSDSDLSDEGFLIQDAGA